MNTIKQIMEDNGKGIHSMFNACMHKAECCSKDAEIAELKRQLEERTEQLRKEYLSAINWAGKHQEAIEKLAESQAREAKYRESLTSIGFVRSPEENASELEEILERMALKALALPHDDTALKEYRDAVIEKCAEVCESMRGWPTDRVVSDDCAKAVRNLKAKP